MISVADPGVVVASACGECPYQAEGTIDGRPWYFRARGDVSLGIALIGGDPVRTGMGWEDGWRREIDDGVYRGYMTDAEAVAFLDRWFAEWRAEGSP